MPSKNRIFDVFHQIPPGIITSPAPGAGSRQLGSKHHVQPAHLGGPVIPPTEEPNTEEYGGGGDPILVEPALSHTATTLPVRPRPLVRHTPPAPIRPRYNILYDQLRSRDAWRYSADGMASGTFTPTAGTSLQNVATVAFAQNPPGFARISEYPGALQYQIVIRSFAILPTAGTMTGLLDMFFVSSGGDPVPLGITNAANTGGGINGVTAICPTPMTDRGLLTVNIGTLFLNAIGIATPVSTAWRMGITLAYMLPDAAFVGYEHDGSQDKKAELVQVRS